MCDLFDLSLTPYEAAPRSRQVVRRRAGRLVCPTDAQSIPFGSLATHLKESQRPCVPARRQGSVLVAPPVHLSCIIVAIALLRRYVRRKRAPWLFIDGR